jgi:hypothetical protein
MVSLLFLEDWPDTGSLREPKGGSGTCQPIFAIGVSTMPATPALATKHGNDSWKMSPQTFREFFASVTEMTIATGTVIGVDLVQMRGNDLFA